MYGLMLSLRLTLLLFFILYLTYTTLHTFFSYYLYNIFFDLVTCFLFLVLVLSVFVIDQFFLFCFFISCCTIFSCLIVFFDSNSLKSYVAFPFINTNFIKKICISLSILIVFGIIVVNVINVVKSNSQTIQNTHISYIYDDNNNNNDNYKTTHVSKLQTSNIYLKKIFSSSVNSIIPLSFVIFILLYIYISCLYYSFVKYKVVNDKY